MEPFEVLTKVAKLYNMDVQQLLSKKDSDELKYALFALRNYAIITYYDIAQIVKCYDMIEIMGIVSTFRKQHKSTIEMLENMWDE